MNPIRLRPITYNAIINMADEEAPREMCGLLTRSRLETMSPLGSPIQDWTMVLLARNVAKAENEYSVDPDTQLVAMSRDDLDVIGVVHSHVRTGPTMSEFDIANAVPEYIYLIWSIAEFKFRAWMVEPYSHDIVGDGEVIRELTGLVAVEVEVVLDPS